MKIPFWRKRKEELNKEIESHLQMSTKDRVERGETLRNAQHGAQKEFGNVGLVKEVTRDMWGWRWLEDFFQDVRYGFRSFRHTPVVTAVAILSLSLGIGANTAIFTLMDALVFRLLPVHKPEQLVQVFHRSKPSGSELNENFTNPLWEELRDRQDIFSGVFAWSTHRFDLSRGGPVQFARGLYVSGGYFGTLGIPPSAGRLIAAADDRRRCAAVAVLSNDHWQSKYSQSPDVIGSTVSIDRHPFQVIGVAAPGFRGVEVGEKFDIAIPICAAAVFDKKESTLDMRSRWWLQIIGRTREGISLEQLNARLEVLTAPVFDNTIPAHWSPADQKEYREEILTATSSARGVSYLRERFRFPLQVLMSVVGMVLLIACANVASLMLARATSRNKEIAVRKALGATRLRLVRQMLTESILLSLVGAALGILFAQWGSALLVNLLSTMDTVVSLDLALNSRILGFTAGVSLLTGILFGVLPAIRSTRVSLASGMKGTLAIEGEKHSRFRPGKWIIASQVALSLVLLITSGLFLRSMMKIVTQDVGFDRNDILIVEANLKESGIVAEQFPATFQELETRLRQLPGVTSAGQSILTPLGRMGWNDFLLFDTPNAPKGRDSIAYFNFVSPGYFPTMRTPVLAGRNFTDADTKSSELVAIVNATLARKFLPNQDPVGKVFRIQLPSGKPGPPILVVGLVKDTKYSSLREETKAIAYFPMTQVTEPVNLACFEMRTDSSLSTLLPAVQEIAGSVNRGISLEFRTMARQIDASLTRERLLATLSGFFGGLALLLAMIGLFGALSYMVTQRQTEFGIRMALGAQPVSILRMVMRDVLVILLAGVIAGVSISYFTVSLLQKLLFGLTPQDTVTWIVSVGVLALVALFAGFLPARRASRVDPMVALRYE